uniref:Peptidase M16 N-terminal domain-containing protein n=1 Tax=Bionectria ochroleuca TaxID=29856 RepID=A0A0B7KQI2_BIOOC
MPPSDPPASAPRPSHAVLLTDNLEKPSEDGRSYRVVRLANQLEVLLVHDPETDKASAALDVNVGNFSDEEGMPGMAHAVEHLLFMGTKKFPAENDYDQYLSSNSGSSNAYTDSTSTNYYFEVAAKLADDSEPTEENPSPLRGALDRFAQFFIEPLFLSSTLDRELKAVDSENKKNLQNDDWRLHQLNKSLSNPKHPYCHFGTGNFEVLKTKPEAKGINVRDKFIEFHSQHYSANLMNLVVLGRESLDVLQKWAEEFFSGVANKELPQQRWDTEVPFQKQDLGMQCFVKPVMDYHELNLVFPFIDEYLLCESQPSRYLSYLIGHKGSGSIMACVKSKGWAVTLSACAYPVCPGTPGLFEISVLLTEEGLKQYPEIVRIIFQYISMLRESPPKEWIFNQQKRMADVDFRFKEKLPASQFTRQTASEMQKPIPREWLLSGSSRLRSFSPKSILKALATLRPDNLRMTIVSQKFPGHWDRREEWYGTEYRYEKLPEDLLRSFETAFRIPPKDRYPELHLPHKNDFIPEGLKVEKKDILQPAIAPKLLRNDSLARTWWKKDDTFWVPKANVYASLRSPIIYASAENRTKARLFIYLVQDALQQYAYDAEFAGADYTVSLDGRCLLLEISGYNDKLAVLLQKVATTIKELEIQDERFEVVKEQLARGIRNGELLSADEQVGDFLDYLNSERDFLVAQEAAELPYITSESVRLFQKQALAQFFLETYTHGNMHREDALNVTEIIEKTFKPRALPHDQIPIIRSLIIPRGSNFIFNKTLKDPNNVNHCVETLLYVGDKADRFARATTLLFDQIAHEPAFFQLRTKEQLGYVVLAGMRNFATTCGIRLLIQSERTPDYLDSRIEAFLVQIGEVLEKMTDVEFEDHKRSVIVKRLKKLENLDQESSRHWSHISGEYYDFEQAQNDAAHVKALTKAQILEFYKTYISPSSPNRARISVHLHARGASELDTKIIALLQQAGLEDVPEEQRQCIDILEKYLTKDLGRPADQVSLIVSEARECGLKRAVSGTETGDIANGSTAVRSAVEITDVRAFKSGLLASSGARPVKDFSEFEDKDSKL